MRWTIYCHTHIATGRRYIGLTKMSMMKRWNRHVYSSKSSKDGFRNNYRFANAIRKYGKEAFIHEELAQCRTLEDANLTEEAVILQYDARNPEKGFNVMRGGLSIPNSIRKNPWNDPVYRAKQILVNSDPAVRKRKRDAANRISPELRQLLNNKLRGRKLSHQSIANLKLFYEKKYKKRALEPIKFRCKKHGNCGFRMKRRANGRCFPKCVECHKEYMKVYNLSHLREGL